MSFVDLTSNVAWNKESVLNRAEAILRNDLSLKEELRILRKAVTRLVAGKPIPDVLKTRLGTIEAAYEANELLQDEALADMKLLKDTIEFEKASIVLSLPEFEGEKKMDVTDETGKVTKQDTPEYNSYKKAKNKAQKVVDTASAEVKALVESRKPVVVVDLDVQVTL